MKWYVVFRGRKPGVYNDWGSCQAQVDGYKGASYRGCRDRNEAEEAYLAYGGTTCGMKHLTTTSMNRCTACTWKNFILIAQMLLIGVMSYCMYN
jgi:viroplasmin and RNaseH domain-containing protein